MFLSPFWARVRLPSLEKPYSRMCVCECFSVQSGDALRSQPRRQEALRRPPLQLQPADPARCQQLRNTHGLARTKVVPAN